MNIARRRMMGKKNGLPSGLHQIEFVELTGTQYFDLNTNYYYPLSIEAKLKMTTGAQGGSVFIGSSYVDGSTTYRFWVASFPNAGNNRLYVNCAWNTNEISTSYVPIGTDITMDIYFSDGAQLLKINGTTYCQSSKSGVNKGGNFPLYIGKGVNHYNGYSTNTAYLRAQIKSIKMEMPQKIYDLIPVRDNNNEGFLFDKNDGTLYGNAGSGNIVIGNDI